MFYQLLLKLSSLSLCLCHDKCHWVCVCKREECVCALKQLLLTFASFVICVCRVRVCVANTNAKGFLSNKNKAASGFHMFLWTLALAYTLIYSSIHIHWRHAAQTLTLIHWRYTLSACSSFGRTNYICYSKNVNNSWLPPDDIQTHTMEYIHTISLLTAPAAWHCWAPGA